jgi:hypothetical protein
MRSAPRLYAVETAVSGVCVCVCEREREREREGHLVSECPLDRPLIEKEWPVAVRSLLLLKRRSYFKTRKSLRKNKNMVMGPDKAQNQDLLYWRRPAAN